MLFKLEAFGIRDIVNQWFKSYSSNRKQYVEIKYMGNISQKFRKVYILLEGNEKWSPSGLGSQSSFVFVIYKDLPINIQGGRTILFADDTNVQIEATNANILNEKIKEVVQQLLSWFSANKLVINTDKTIAISFHAWKIKVT